MITRWIELSIPLLVLSFVFGLGIAIVSKPEVDLILNAIGIGCIAFSIVSGIFYIVMCIKEAAQD